MKNNIENSFKDALGNFEVPYDAKAWDALSKRLDVTMPNQSPVQPKSNTRWWLAAGVVATLIGAATTYYFTTEEQTNTPQISQNDTNEGIDTKKDQKILLDDAHLNGEHSTNENSDDGYTNVNSSTNIDLKNTNSSNIKENLSCWTGPFPTMPNLNINDFEKNNEDETKQSSDKGSSIFEVQNLENICLGTTWNLENKNTKDLVILDPNGKTVSIKQNERLNFKPTVAGEYLIGMYNGANFEAKKTLFVNEGKGLDFEIDDDTPYENGIPSIRLYTNSPDESLVWTAENNQQKLVGNEVEVHYFKKGTYIITLENKAANGCQAKTSKELTIEEDFNLLAPEAFRPYSSDNTVNRFMPRSLQEREVRFELVIIDPVSGEVVYRTTDKYSGWDGYDQRTGKMVDFDKSYVWKVVIANAAIGEKPVYNGTVVMKR